MSVEVRLPTLLRPHVGGNSSLEVEGNTVGQVIDQMVSIYPDLEGQIITPNGDLHKFINIYLNDDDIRYLDKLDTKLNAGDTISILPAVAGGL